MLTPVATEQLQLALLNLLLPDHAALHPAFLHNQVLKQAA